MPVQLIDADDRITVCDADIPGIADGDKDTTYTLRPIAVDDYREIVKANSVDVIDRRTHQKTKQTDWEKVNDDQIDFVLVAWTGIVVKGQPAECSRANKLKLDGVRRQALCDRAGINQIQRAPEVRAESFRESA